MNLIIYSTEDACGTNCAKFLFKRGFVEQKPIDSVHGKKRFWLKDDVGILETSERLSVAGEYLSALGVVQESDLIILPYRHKSSSSRPILTAHVTGNFSNSAEYGGNPKQLPKSCAGALKFVHDYFQSNSLPTYEFAFEANHHGPTSLPKPIVFIELGSGEKQWNDLTACEYLSNLVFSLASKPIAELLAENVFIGFGGTHYTDFVKQLPKSRVFSFVASKHALDGLDADLVKQMVENTTEKVALALIDWKGCSGEQRKKVISLLEEQNIRWEKA